MKEIGLTRSTVEKFIFYRGQKCAPCPVHRRINTSGSLPKVNWSDHRETQKSQTYPDLWGRYAGLPWVQHRNTRWWSYQSDAVTYDISDIYWLAPFQRKGKKLGTLQPRCQSFWRDIQDLIRTMDHLTTDRWLVIWDTWRRDHDQI